ncbi:2-C-methyl-D-erythritol 2,4-cyclodiphosphate synthase [Fusobacterium sp. IOR10]|uniref:2-C-methyl-D-erythritol 2,4-cyclodiphosphate synthase n=1 Tax=Fusobacterium sp. IOR10 TaxID=2665157 RepID=UPI0013D1AA66|nr:2-C-methyl-D-erythritol 2,4-cyclodiphosphate synthase [Fusobacterium sp. IOR10]
MIRIGNGYDVHKLVIGRKLILGGIEIPYEKGLLGHSDADVLIHAIIDAILGALALGDIGQHFPDDDNKYLNIDSLVLLKKTKELMNEKNYKIGNLDSIIIAQRPKLKNYLNIMRKNISEVLDVDISKISIKATTEENLGFTGREEGIKSYCVVILKKDKL